MNTLVQVFYMYFTYINMQIITCLKIYSILFGFITPPYYTYLVKCANDGVNFPGHTHTFKQVNTHNIYYLKFISIL